MFRTWDILNINMRLLCRKEPSVAAGTDFYPKQRLEKGQHGMSRTCHVPYIKILSVKPPMRISTWLWVLLGCTLLGVAWALLWQTIVGQAFDNTLWFTLVAPEVLFWNAYGLTAPAVVWLARRLSFSVRPFSKKWLVHVPLALVTPAAAYGLFAMLYAVYHATGTALGWPVAGTLDQQLLRRAYTFFSLLPMGCALYCMLVALTNVGSYFRQLQDEEHRSAGLKTQLARAKLQALKMQLQPHFLFNALNTISSTLQTDPPAADRMLAELGDFLRLTLEHADRATVSLAEEIHFNRCYLDIQRHRFEDRLVVDITVEPGLERAAVPYLVLQPLVENAIRHGISQRVEAGEVRIEAYREGEALVLEVFNTGPDLRAGGDGAFSTGIGLATTRSRLQQQYGDKASFQLEEEVDGVRARVRLPLSWHASTSDSPTEPLNA